MTSTVDDVAAHVLGQFPGGVSTMKLQKLCYFGQGWALALLKRPLFADDFQAWRGGPVCYPLYQHHAGMHTVQEWPRGSDARLDAAQKIVLDAVVKNYGALSGPQLSDLTHQPGTPWSVVRSDNRLRAGQSSNAVISKELIQDFFTRTLFPNRQQ